MRDKAAVEAFFKTIKAELIWRHPWEARRKADLAIEYINGLYNPRQRHSVLRWKVLSLSNERWHESMTGPD